MVLAEDRRTDKEVVQGHCGDSQGSIEQWLASGGLSVVSSSSFNCFTKWALRMLTSSP